MPIVNRNRSQPYHRQAYPGRLRQRTEGCWKWRLSDDGGLTQFGAGEVQLEPGAATGLYHWHEREDEFVYVLEGEVVLIEGGDEHVLGPGDAVAFKAGDRVGHSFENRSRSPVRLLEVGLRHPDGETAHYPGLDLVYRRDASGIRFQRRDGTALKPDDEVAKIDGDPEDRKPPSPLDAL
jgi:uncharacterized cupin superfamily protein